jgi:hypothetical protein
MPAPIVMLLLSSVAGCIARRSLRASQCRGLSSGREGIRASADHATAAPPHPRRRRSGARARNADPSLRVLTQAALVANASTTRLLALRGPGLRLSRNSLLEPAGRALEGRLHVWFPGYGIRRILFSTARAAVAAHVIEGSEVGALVAVYGHERRLEVRACGSYGRQPSLRPGGLSAVVW